jgi:transposase
LSAPCGREGILGYSGKKPRLCDRETGEVRDVELFVMVLGASNVTYAEETNTQKLR